MKNIILSLSLVLAFVACNGTHEGRIGENDISGYTLDSLLADSTRELRNSLPIFFDSTQVLLHPIGYYTLEKDGSRYLESMKSSKSSGYGSSSHYDSKHGDELYGQMTNLVFEDLEQKTSFRPLTPKLVNIQQISYLRNYARQSKRHYLIYRLQDQDHNRDGQIAGNDLTALYISALNGEGFAKLSPENQNVEHAYWVDWCQRYYFDTREYVEKDGQILRGTKSYQFYVDFSVHPYQLVAYDALVGILNKK